MTYGMAPPMHPHHLHQAADSASSVPQQAYGGHQQQPGQYGASQMGSNLAYSNQGFYGHPAQHHPSEVASQQHPAGYYSHHGSSPQMDSNGQLYAAHQMSHPDMMAGGQFQGHHPDLLAHQQHGYAALQGAGIRPKRKQVKNACINCQKACKKCDEGRPCGRCVKYGLVDTCQDSARKERRRGIKRGPYKRRATTGPQPNNPSLSVSGPISSSYGRDGHISPSSRSDGMLSNTPGGESNFSSPAFNTQVLAPRPPLPLQIPNNQWQPNASPNADDRDGLRARYGQPIASSQQSYYGYEQEGAHHAYDRSSSAPVNQNGSMVSPAGRFPNAGTPQSATSQLPSLGSQSNGGYLGGVYGNGGGHMGGMSNGSTSSLISPPLHSSASSGGSFLSASSAPNGIAHHRLHFDSSLATLSSAGASSSIMSPRTPLNRPGSEPPLLSPGGNKMSGFTPPQPTVPTVAGTFLQQDTSRPFPLKMPKAPARGRSGTGSSYLDQQPQGMRNDGYYQGNLAPINAKMLTQQQQQQQQFQRSAPYMAVQGMDERRQFLSNTTPRMDLSPNPGMMSIKVDRDVGGPPPPAPAGSLGLA